MWGRGLQVISAVAGAVLIGSTGLRWFHMGSDVTYFLGAVDPSQALDTHDLDVPSTLWSRQVGPALVLAVAGLLLVAHALLRRSLLALGGTAFAVAGIVWAILSRPRSASYAHPGDHAVYASALFDTRLAYGVFVAAAALLVAVVVLIADLRCHLTETDG